MKPKDNIFYLLNKASQAGNRCLATQLKPFPVTPAQALVLLFLRDEDAVTSARLGERAGLDSATLTGIIDRLEKLDLAERRKNPADRRAIKVCLTERGKRITEEIHTVTEKANNSFQANLSEIEKKIFRTLLRRVRAE